LALQNLDLKRLNKACGSATVSKGRVYYEANRVVNFTTARDEQAVTGMVKGSRGAVYRVAIFLSGGEFAGGDCTCPVGSNCKHVVAVALAAAGAAKEFALKAKPAEWQASLERLMRKAQDASDALLPPPNYANTATPLGLQFRVDGLIKDASKRAQAAKSVIGISVRPVERNSQTGNWTGGWSVSWDNLRRRGFSSAYDPVVAEWFAELSAMRSQGYWGAPDWVSLSDFPDRLLWQQLALGRELAVPFVGFAKRDQYILADSAAVTLDVTKSMREVRLSSVLTIDGVPISNKIKGPIGFRGIYAITEPIDPKSGWIITLAPTQEQLTQGAVALLELGSELIIPEADLPAFLHDYLPNLRRHIPMASSDDSVLIPESPEPELVITATFPKPTIAQLSAHWEYHADEDNVVSFRGSQQDNHHPIRDHYKEQHIWQALTQTLTRAGISGLRVNEDLGFTEFAALQLVNEILPAIAKVPSVRTEIIGNPSFTELTEQPIIELKSKDSPDADWFDLAVTVKVAGREIPLPNLLHALAEGKKALMLVDGSWLHLNHPALEQLRALLSEADQITDKRGKLRLSRYHVGLWDELADLADIVEQTERWRSSVSALHELVKAAKNDSESIIPPVPLPAGVNATLRPYQLHGFHWLAFCYKYGLGAILADDMGLGKTLQALSLIAHVRENVGSPAIESSTAIEDSVDSPGASQSAEPRETSTPPFLVVAPASVVGNWLTEATRFAPQLKVAVVNHTGQLAGINAQQQPGAVTNMLHGIDIVVTSYAIFRLDAERFAAYDWSGLILDEAQFIKNKATKANQAARKLKAPFKLAMTGTPMENNVSELWALLAVVAPGLLGSFEKFRENYARPIDAIHRVDADDQIRAHGHNRIELLRRRVSPLMLRRTKEQVAPELPPRIEQVQTIELDPKHRRVYDIHLARERQRVLGLLNDFEANKVAVFRALTTLRRLALDATLIDPDAYAGTPSSKLDALFEQLESVVAEGHRALIFSQFTSYLELVAQRAKDYGFDFAYLTGATRNRTAVIDGFKQGEVPLFLISLKAGGFGLNLTEADYVFILDPWWNPAVEAQAVDRTHRIGQKRSVNVVRLVSGGTIEEKVMALKERKAALVGEILRDGENTNANELGAQLTAADIRSLLDA